MSEIRLAREWTGRWIAFDLEATGFAFGMDRIIEIAWVAFVLQGDGSVKPGERVSFLVNPGRPVPEEITALTGLDDEALAGAAPLSTHWERMRAAFQGQRVVSHRVASDLAWLAAEANRGALPALEATFYCSLKVARASVAAPSYALGPLGEHLEIRGELHGAHRALTDALQTRNLWAHCLRAARAKPEQLERAMRPVPWPPASDFVVHLPKSLAGLPALCEAGAPIQIVYQGGSRGPAPRLVSPLGLYAHREISYLRAYCHVDQIEKNFRLSRIAQLIIPPSR